MAISTSTYEKCPDCNQIYQDSDLLSANDGEIHIIKQNSEQLTVGKTQFNITGFRLFGVSLLIIYGFFSYLLIAISLQYIPYNTDVAFLRIKQDVIDFPFYKLAFFTHVYTAVFVLPAGFTQFSGFIRKKFPRVHKYTGWVYAIVVICLAGPAGFYMGLFANGGLTSQVSFCLLAVLWIYFTGTALAKVIRGDIKSHREFLIRSFALTLSAITLRAWKYMLVFLFHPRPMDVYEIAAWLGWIPNLIIAEIIIRKNLKF
jgi:uncharacterized membrane protein